MSHESFCKDHGCFHKISATIKSWQKWGQGKRKCLAITVVKVLLFQCQEGSSAFAWRWVKAALQVSASVWWGSTAAVTVGALEAEELHDCRWRRAALSNATTVMARNQAGSWQVSPCCSVLSASYERGIFLPGKDQLCPCAWWTLNSFKEAVDTAAN